MAAKRRRRRARKRAHTPKRTAHKRKKRRNPVRAVAANPRKRRRRVRRAAGRRRTSAKRRHRRRNPVASTARMSVGNPRKRHKRRSHGKRRHRRNPGIPTWAMGAIGALVGLVGYAVANAGTMAITAATDPSGATLTRNRYIAGGALAIGGLAVAALASPAIGVGLAAAGAVALVGSRASMMLAEVVTPSASTEKRIQGIGGPRELRQLGIGAVGNSMQGVASTMGALEVGAIPPWANTGSPF